MYNAGMPYNPVSVANRFLNLSFANDRPIGHMKLQKLVYFAHGYYLAATGQRGKAEPLIDEFFEAWPYGPVAPSLYEEFKESRGAAITRPGLVYNSAFGARIVAAPPENDPVFDKVIDYVWTHFSGTDAFKLSDLTHKQNGAWDRARKESGGLRGKDIPNDYILDDFKNLVKMGS